MTLGPRRRHEPCVPIDGTKCIFCGQYPNDYSYHLKLLAFMDGKLVWEGTCPKWPARFSGDTGDHDWKLVRGHAVCTRCGVAKQ